MGRQIYENTAQCITEISSAVGLQGGGDPVCVKDNEDLGGKSKRQAGSTIIKTTTSVQRAGK